VARFAARFGFAVAPETMALMRSMVANGEADALVPERVWQEFSRGLMEGEAALMFQVLAEAGLLQRLLPELKLVFEHGRPANDSARTLVHSLDRASAERLGLAPRFALVASRAESGELVRILSERLKAPADCRDLAIIVALQAEAVKRAAGYRGGKLLSLLEHCDALRRPKRFEELLAVLECVERGEKGWVEIPYPPRVRLRRALAAAAGIDAGAIAAKSAKTDIPAKVRKARIAAIEALG
jgi:tRNA nucleotidyltransferase (CCA-adding enzyme)